MIGDRPLRVAVAGLRGFPGVPGGAEAHAQRLYPRLTARGCQVEVFVRAPHMPTGAPSVWNGVRLTPLWSPSRSGAEALVHTAAAVLVARRGAPDILHLHNIGPALTIPLARALGMPVVVTHHSLNYRHEKWGRAARFLLRAGERASARFAAARIAVSPEIQDVLLSDYGAKSVLIPNGVALEPWRGGSGLLEGFGVEPQRYFLFVGRFSPEKRLLDLLDAFSGARLEGWQLVITGDGTRNDEYRQAVIDRARTTSRVILTGFQDGPQLSELYARAGCFVLPSSHEGQPIALLEALASGIPAIVSDLPAHRGVGLPQESFFPPGDVDRLCDRLRRFAEADLDRSLWSELSVQVRSTLDWDRIADRTLEVLAAAAGRVETASR